jgi:Zn2+/Cd2+-exporting ATPase
MAEPPVGSETTLYRVDNMDGPTEEAMIRDKLGTLDGVTGLSFNLLQRTLAVSHRLARLPQSKRR